MECVALVSRRASTVDCRRVVVDPPRAPHPITVHRRWRSAMNIGKNIQTLAAASIGFAVSLSCVFAGQSLKVDFSNETVGAEAKSFLSVVGVWRIETDGNNKVLVVDGRQWKEGQTAAGVADKARALYGDRYAEFLDRVQAYAYFPYAVAKHVAD